MSPVPRASVLRRVPALLLAIASATSAIVLASTSPAGASPVGYLSVVVNAFADGTGDAPVAPEDVGAPESTTAPEGAAEGQGDVGAQQFAECQLAQVDLGTGAVTSLPHISGEACVEDLTLSPDGRVFGIQQRCGGELCDLGALSELSGLASQLGGKVDTAQFDLAVHLIELDPTTGVPTDLGPIDGEAFTGLLFTGLPTPLGFGGITFDQDGTLFVEMIGFEPPCGFLATCLYRVDPANPGAAEFVGHGDFFTVWQVLAAGCGTPEAVTLEPSDELLVGSNPEVGPEALPVPDQLLWSRDLATGDTTAIGPTGEDVVLTGMAFDSSNVLWGVGLVGEFFGIAVPSVFRIDPATGAALPTVPLLEEGEPVFPVGLALPLDCPEELVVRFTG